LKRFIETAKNYNISRPTLYMWIEKGCPAHHVGKIPYFDWEEVDEWIKGNNKRIITFKEFKVILDKGTRDDDLKLIVMNLMDPNGDMKDSEKIELEVDLFHGISHLVLNLPILKKEK